jgi:MFS transporter, DHA1 family, tetracycline resistance protein
MGAAFGLGFIIGPAIGGLAGEYGPRVPFFAAAGLAAVNFIYGTLVLPETLPPERRRPFSLIRSNPVGAFNVFRQYRGVIPLCIVMFIYFFATSVYPAIWAFFGIARFGWSEFTIGLTLSGFGLFTAVVQGTLTGPVVKHFGEWNAALIGLVVAAIAATGYGLAPGLIAVLVLLLIHSPEGFVYPALTALMSKEAPPDAQGELQGGIASIQNIAMLLGTVFYAQIFGYFTGKEAPVYSPSMAFYVAAALAVATIAYFVLYTKRPAR